MAFEEIRRQTAARSATAGGAVTVAWRTTSKRGNPRLVLTLTAPLARQMGWVGRGHACRVYYCADTNRLRLEKCDPTHPQARAVSMMGRRADTATVSPSLPHITRREPAPAEALAYDLEDGALVVTLPRWAEDRSKRAAREAAERARAGFRLGLAHAR